MGGVQYAEVDRKDAISTHTGKSVVALDSGVFRSFSGHRGRIFRLGSGWDGKLTVRGVISGRAFARLRGVYPATIWQVATIRSAIRAWFAIAYAAADDVCRPDSVIGLNEVHQPTCRLRVP
jgi:hypothetical protein